MHLLNGLSLLLAISPLPLAADASNSHFCNRVLPANQKIGTTSNITIVSSGIKRYFLLTIPPRYYTQASSPVILSYHGGSRDAARQLSLSQFSNTDFNDFAITVYPNGINNTWQGTPGQIPNNINDVKFTSDILNYLESRYCVDKSRIFASGKSNGGGFTNFLACDHVLSKRIAAFAPVAGSYYVENVNCSASTPATLPITCNPGRFKIPIIIFHSEKDGTISYNGGPRKGACLPAIPHIVHEWARRDGLGLHNWTSRLGSDTNIYQYGTGLDYGLVTHVKNTVIGHDWPATIPNDDNTQEGRTGPASFNATPIIIEFFLRHPLTTL